MAEYNSREEVLKKRQRMEAAAQSSTLSFNAEAMTELNNWRKQERARRVHAVRLLQQGTERSAVAIATNLEFETVKELKARNGL
jgi:hypothetical protein